MSKTKKLTPQEVVAEFRKTLVDKTLEELREIEQEVIKQADEDDKMLQSTEFKMPEANRKAAMEAIRRRIEEISVGWQYTLGMKNIYDHFNPEKEPKTVSFAMLDSTLRTLGALKFQGHVAWDDIVVINDYFEPIREKYAELGQKVFINAEKHSAVISSIELFEKQGEAVQEIEEAAAAE